ncbi:CD3072 family TudS-related putative desulfidase [Campylobacterota bacterium DY0563]
MNRSKKIILLSHCILNANAKVYSLANYKGCLAELIKPLCDKGYGILQLPCPEMLTCGVNRWGMVKEQYETPIYKQQFKKMLLPIVNQVIDYKNNGYEVDACIGIDGSPNCGINKTCRAQWKGEIDKSFDLDKNLDSLKTVDEAGVYMEVLFELLEENGVSLTFYALDEENPTASVQNILKEI